MIVCYEFNINTPWSIFNDLKPIITMLFPQAIVQKCSACPKHNAVICKQRNCKSLFNISSLDFIKFSVTTLKLFVSLRRILNPFKYFKWCVLQTIAESHYFTKKILLQIFDRALNTPLFIKTSHFSWKFLFYFFCVGPFTRVAL